jgi:hypothetical protein
VLMRASIVKPQQAERTHLIWGLVATICVQPDDRLAASCANLAVYCAAFLHWQHLKRILY